MDISTSSDFSIDLSNEEKEVLQKAKEILVNMSKEMWQSDYDAAEDYSYVPRRIADNIQSVMDGRFDCY